jgi:hypothetical protein
MIVQQIYNNAIQKLIVEVNPALPQAVGQIGVVRLKDRTLSPVAERFLEVQAETTGRRGARARQQ